ncbi:hypothetical protein FD29_GL001863 [Companilactobacillus mindensis DSM 14500]|uniref:Cation-transporting P-type ATPase N-terminal domain-containing protein n=1 Tax=Companilactobacillus mindensis DSM 14500 TaxID=1423770 RepID=A0A0R1QM74_9LACO|nr:cation-transporting P-type ATPase [Companilactobacillus mindensis]KRL45862.1 hypothetical protein FD29_GL001863 [Companilactobacillus mindensis DSM 14500]GEO77723.1 hypothetical protein LMI01_00540 [Companilactobacillus mindensis]
MKDQHDTTRYYALTEKQLLKDLQTNSEGLVDSEASKRLATNGPNALAQGKKQTIVQKFFNQFKDFMIIVLLVAAFVSGVIAKEWG